MSAVRDVANLLYGVLGLLLVVVVVLAVAPVLYLQAKWNQYQDLM